MEGHCTSCRIIFHKGVSSSQSHHILSTLQSPTLLGVCIRSSLYKFSTPGLTLCACRYRTGIMERWGIASNTTQGHSSQLASYQRASPDLPCWTCCPLPRWAC